MNEEQAGDATPFIPWLDYTVLDRPWGNMSGTLSSPFSWLIYPRQTVPELAGQHTALWCPTAGFSSVRQALRKQDGYAAIPSYTADFKMTRQDHGSQDQEAATPSFTDDFCRA